MNELAGVNLHYIETLDEANAFMSWLGERRVILSVDTETTGLKPWKDHVRLVQFGDAHTGWTIRWDRWGGLGLEALKRYEDPIVYHNAKFDTQMLERWCDFKPTWDRVHDTAIMARLLDPTMARALKPLAAQYIDPSAPVGQAMLEKAMADGGWNWETIPYEVPAYTVYAAMDTVLTARLFEVLYPRVKTQCAAAYDLEREFAETVINMEQHGSMIDIKYTQDRLNELERYIIESTMWCEDNYGVSPGSHQKVVKRLLEEGVDFTKKTRGGDWALDAEVLESIDHPLAQTVLQRRRVQKISSTYLSNFISMQDDEHVIRPSMDTLGAATGRMSMELLQTLPRRSDKNPLASIVRNCIVSRPGNVLFMCDWDQIEMRVLTHLAKDPGLIEAFNQGDDFFLNLAQETFAEPEMKRADERRQMIKNAMYAKAYGAGVAKFSLTAGIPLELGTQVMSQLDTKYPGIKSLQRQVDKVAHERVRVEGRPYVLSPLTGKPFYLKDDDKIYALVNYMIQGTAAEVLKMKAVEMNRAGLGKYLTLFVHDEVIGDVPLDEAREVSDMVSQIMNDDKIFAPVPVTATLGLGHRWGEKGDVKMEDLP